MFTVDSIWIEDQKLHSMLLYLFQAAIYSRKT